MSSYSVLMSVYKKEHPEYLKLSIESILRQSVQTNDFILVCDGPLTQELDRVIISFAKEHPEIFHTVRLEKNVGLGPALNEGLKYCKNELVARMDSDDFALANRCELQLKAFAAMPELAIVGGSVHEFMGSPENVVSVKRMPQNHDDIVRYAKRRCPFNHPTVMYRRSAVLAAGGYPNVSLHEDYALWARMLSDGTKGCNLTDTLCCMRVDSGLYGRRGGVKYYKTAVKFRWYLYKQRFCNIWELLYSVAGLSVVCLVPTSIRKMLYKKVLRTGRVEPSVQCE